MAEEGIWTVFVTANSLNQASCQLYGNILNERKVIFLSDDVIRRDKNEVLCQWNSNVNHTKSNRSVVILTNTKEGFISCHVNIESVSTKSNLVIYEPQQFIDSYFLDPFENIKTSESKSVDNSAASKIRIVDCITHEVYQQKKIQNTKWEFQHLVLKFLSVFHILGYVLDNRFMKNNIIQTVMKIPSIFCHQLSRKKECNKADFLLQKGGRLKVKLGLCNLASRQMLDTALGMTLMFVMMQKKWSDTLAVIILNWAHTVAEQLTILLQWLMGAPAGLKLNSQLTQFLGHFFLYHISLWRGYLAILEPVLGSILWYSSLLGILGLTAQLCLLRDIFSIMTLHIYCFYVYAARLYRLQVYLLSAFWRLFRGKKWNVLRHRIDSASYDVDQLFLGTLLFTIVLFTFPTSALYYVVFTALRLLVLMVQGILHHIVTYFQNYPVYSVVLWLLQSKSVAGDVLFRAVPNNGNGTNSSFTLQVIQMPFSQLILKSLNPFMENVETEFQWSNLIKDIMIGHLVYPWMEVKRS